MPTFEFVVSSDQFSQAEVQPGAGETGDVIQRATNQRVLLPTTEKPISLYSSMVTHMSLKVESEHSMEPPTHAPYMEYGQVDTCTGVEEGREEGETGGRVRNLDQNPNKLGIKMPIPKRTSQAVIPPWPPSKYSLFQPLKMLRGPHPTACSLKL